MTNGEKYKTAKERILAHKEWCDSHRFKSRNGVCPTKNCMECVFNWLDLEDEEEKPMNCPFCGGDCIVEETIPSGHYYCQCISGKHCNYGSGRAESRDKAIAAHNRVYKAVAAYKGSEVK